MSWVFVIKKILRTPIVVVALFWTFQFANMFLFCFCFWIKMWSRADWKYCFVWNTFSLWKSKLYMKTLSYLRFLNCLRIRWTMKIFSRDTVYTCSYHPSSKQTSWIFNSHNPRDWPNHWLYCSMLIVSSWRSYSSFCNSKLSRPKLRKQSFVICCESPLLAPFLA